MTNRLNSTISQRTWGIEKFPANKFMKNFHASLVYCILHNKISLFSDMLLSETIYKTIEQSLGNPQETLFLKPQETTVMIGNEHKPQPPYLLQVVP